MTASPSSNTPDVQDADERVAIGSQRNGLSERARKYFYLHVVVTVIQCAFTWWAYHVPRGVDASGRSVWLMPLFAVASVVFVVVAYSLPLITLFSAYIFVRGWFRGRKYFYLGLADGMLTLLNWLALIPAL